jgi:DNA polymerase-3 subunit beta
MQIAFNAKFMVEMLNSTESEEVTMELSSPSKAGIMKPVSEEEGEELLMLVMPLVVNQ